MTKLRIAAVSVLVAIQPAPAAAGGGAPRATSTAAITQAPTFSTRVVSVPIDALVTDDDGHPIAGLGLDDFELLDDGARQPIELVSVGKLPVNVVLALDASSSVIGDRLLRLREAAEAVVADLKPGDEAALVSFSHYIRRGTPLTTDVASAGEALARLAPGGETSLADGAYAALLTGRAEARTVVIVFSDGIDTRSWLTPEAVVDAARRSNAVVYAVTAGSGRGSPFLRDLTRTTGGAMQAVESDRDIRGAFVRILEEFRARYLLGFTPGSAARPGWHTLQVRVKGRRASVRAREGYIAGP